MRKGKSTRVKLYTKRFDIKMTQRQFEVLEKIAKHFDTTNSDAIRICIFECWGRM